MNPAAVNFFLVFCAVVACGGLWMASRPTTLLQPSQKTGRSIPCDGQDVLVVRLSDKPVCRETSQDGNTRISYAADGSIVEIVMLSGPQYEPDDGPLTDKQLAALRKDVAERLGCLVGEDRPSGRSRSRFGCSNNSGYRQSRV